ncbi:two-component system sensor histidine kinase NtrB [Rariglobus hedericola]|uniref:two-component system sensor histidine kinase NtrB n=1 Tax=Rariglobus hedericola TaxID=2597822 RepID=UPI001396C05D|nr:ATP-binding protein [Rariglobus hedericola]
MRTKAKRPVYKKNRVGYILQLLPWLLCAIFAGLLLRIHREKRLTERAHASTSDHLERTSLTLTRISQAVESASDAIGIGDMESNSLYHNRAHIAMFGHTVHELNSIDEPAALFVDKSVAMKIHASIRAGVSWHGETDVKTRDGRVIPAFVRADIIRDEAGAAIGIFGVFTDITERRAAERVLAEESERSARAQRLESLGMLAGGVAHDFGNLLTIIIGNTGILQSMSATLPPGAVKRTGEIESAAWRAQELSKNLLAFARGSDPQKQQLLLGPLIDVAARGAVRHSMVELSLKIAPDLAAVQADPVQIDQVISNLCVNAVQAMVNGGRLRVAAQNADGWNGAASGSPFDGPVVIVTITDTGGGIPADVLPRIWEPFFTTKHKGTGLGLATVYAVVKKHGGNITVDSVPDMGTTFTLTLPAVVDKTKTAARSADGMQMIG